MEQQLHQEKPKYDTKTLQRRIQADESKNSHKRKFERHKIFAVGEMVLMNNSQRMDGVVDEISTGGLRFRPASAFIMERNGEAVSMTLGELQVSGRIRATRADGYGVQLLDQLSESQLNVVIEQYQT
ncbi:MAG: PilZ domain-containing protein [Devosiaceae bacterium]|nr:PilZ domain-containing protein [Devosiaceae bacterium]